MGRRNQRKMMRCSYGRARIVEERAERAERSAVRQEAIRQKRMKESREINDWEAAFAVISAGDVIAPVEFERVPVFGAVKAVPKHTPTIMDVTMFMPSCADRERKSVW